MRLSSCRFATVQLDACSDLVRVSGAVAKRRVHLRTSEDRVLDERRDGIWLARQILHRHDDLPNIRATKQPCPSAGRTIAEGDKRMFVAAGSLLGIATQPIRESLASGACPADVVVSTPGVTPVTRTVTDKAGNTASITVNVRIDNQGPSSTFDGGSFLLVLPGGTITGKATDDFSGLASLTVKFSNGFGSSTANARLT